MGFGLICAGLATLLFLRLVPAELVGFTVIVKGLTRLRRYNGFFEAAFWCAVITVAFSAVDAVFWVLKLLGVTAGIVMIETVLGYVHMMCLLPFQLFLFKGLEAISASLGFEKGQKRAVLASSAAVVYYIVYALSNLGLSFGVYLNFATLVLFFVNLALTELAVYTCYKAITTDEAEKKEEEKLARFEKQFGRKKEQKKTHK